MKDQIGIIIYWERGAYTSILPPDLIEDREKQFKKEIIDYYLKKYKDLEHFLRDNLTNNIQQISGYSKK